MTILDAFRLDGKVAIVTGASSGLGVAFATGLAEAGADVAICARRVEKLEETKGQVEALGRRCIAVRADVANPDDCNRVVEQTVGELAEIGAGATVGPFACLLPGASVPPATRTGAFYTARGGDDDGG